jgi:PAS domain S-box-containing protein
MRDDGRMRHANPAWRILGYEPGQLEGFQFLKLVHPDDLNKVIYIFRELDTQDVSGWSHRFRMLHKGNGTLWMWIHASHWNTLGRSFVELRDATEAVEYEASLQRSEALFRALTEQALDGVALLDANLKNIYHTPAVQRIMGYTPEQRRGRSALELVHPKDVPLVEKMLRDCVERGEMSGNKIRMRRSDGEWIAIEWRVTNRLNDPAIRSIVVNYRADPLSHYTQFGETIKTAPNPDSIFE